jgi:pimeloyl-ACP methyl ester carboxylesterase
MPYVDIRGVSHYYEWICQNNARSPEKPVLVFVHGWGGSGRYWESTAQALSDSMDCLIYDLRGFGRSLLPKPVPPEVAAIGYELETYADDLALLLDHLGLSKIYLNAHSAGASIATYFLNRYADRVEQAILTCNGIFEYNKFAFEAFYLFGGYVVQFRPAWLAKVPLADRMFMARFLHRPLPRDISRAFLEDFLIADYDSALGTIYTCVSKKAVEVMPVEFAQITVPTLMISGQYDQIIPAKMGKHAASLNERIEFIEMPKTAHFPMLEDSETYLAHVRNFLKLSTPSAV